MSVDSLAAIEYCVPFLRILESRLAIQLQLIDTQRVGIQEDGHEYVFGEELLGSGLC